MKKLFNDSFENWIFDLDNTIYDIKAGLFVKISERITQYIMEVLSFTKEEANLVRSDMYKKYGLTLTGLMREYEIDPDEYLDFIHDVTHPELQYEKQLKLSLNNLSGKKFIYTNASQDHAKKILSEMGFMINIDDNSSLELISLKRNDKIINTMQQLINGNISDINLDTISLDNRKKISKFLYQKLCFYFEGFERLKSFRVIKDIFHS